MISAVVLSHNDGKIIEKTLSSITWCDEVIVIDDDSVDDTKKIAINNKARVYVHPLQGNFAAQRNFAFSKAKGDWILFIDSDEIVSESLRQEIQRIIDTTTYSGFYLKRQDELFGKVLTHGETGSVRLIRLAKKSAGTWTRPVHEVWIVRGDVGELTQPILHYPHPDVAQFITDINTYSTLNANYLYAQRVKEPVWYIVLYPCLKFLYNYVLRMGFLDGLPGAISAIMMSFHSFLTRAKLYMLWHKREAPREQSI